MWDYNTHQSVQATSTDAPRHLSSFFHDAESCHSRISPTRHWGSKQSLIETQNTHTSTIAQPPNICHASSFPPLESSPPVHFSLPRPLAYAPLEETASSPDPLGKIAAMNEGISLSVVDYTAMAADEADNRLFDDENVTTLSDECDVVHPPPQHDPYLLFYTRLQNTAVGGLTVARLSVGGLGADGEKKEPEVISEGERGGGTRCVRPPSFPLRLFASGSFPSSRVPSPAALEMRFLTSTAVFDSRV